MLKKDDVVRGLQQKRKELQRQLSIVDSALSVYGGLTEAPAPKRKRKLSATDGRSKAARDRKAAKEAKAAEKTAAPKAVAKPRSRPRPKPQTEDDRLLAAKKKRAAELKAQEEAGKPQPVGRKKRPAADPSE